MSFEVDKKTFQEIENLIHSEASPVGIDAKVTHILILNKLKEICDRLDKIEAKLNSTNQ